MRRATPEARIEQVLAQVLERNARALLHRVEVTLVDVGVFLAEEDLHHRKADQQAQGHGDHQLHQAYARLGEVSTVDHGHCCLMMTVL
ncbi:hypothetical protein D9M70_636050 [compost metagenome]